MSEQIVHFAGPCPFLSCLRDSPHDHPVCPECGAVRYGNIDCPTCQKHAHGAQDEVQAETFHWQFQRVESR